MIGDQEQAVLDANELALLLRHHGTTVVEASPLQPVLAVDPAGSIDTLEAKGALGSEWALALSVLGAPSRQARTLTTGRTHTFVQTHYGSLDSGDRLVGCWLEDGGMRISFPWEMTDIAALAGAAFLRTPSRNDVPRSATLSLAALEALSMAVDAVRMRALDSTIANQSDLPGRFTKDDLRAQADPGAWNEDAWSLVGLLRVLAPPSVILVPDAVSSGLPELVDSGLVSMEGSDWVPSPGLTDLALQLLDPLPVVAHELVESVDGELGKYRYHIALRGDGPIWSLEYLGLGSGEEVVVLESLDGMEYLGAVIGLLTAEQS